MSWLTCFFIAIASVCILVLAVIGAIRFIIWLSDYLENASSENIDRAMLTGTAILLIVLVVIITISCHNRGF